jgi:heptosyltransferase II
MVISQIKAKPWTAKEAPGKILAIRFQALGDTVITLPYLNNLAENNRGIEIDFLTRKEVSAIPKNLHLFHKVIEIGGGRNAKLQFALMLLKIPYLILQGYDAVIDLQNNKISRIVRKLLFPKAYAEFDRSSPNSAGARTARTISAIGLGANSISTRFRFKTNLAITSIVPRDKINIVLNPAGYCPSRNWPLENYVEFARKWIEHAGEKVQFILLLMPTLNHKALFIEERLGKFCLNLSGKANQQEAFQVISKCSLIVSEDSGLMHMAWVQGIPTVALFSSSRKDWSAPQGENSVCLDSSDLECGPCQLETCKYNDNRCLTRYSPSQVFEVSRKLLEKT